MGGKRGCSVWRKKKKKRKKKKEERKKKKKKKKKKKREKKKKRKKGGTKHERTRAINQSPIKIERKQGEWGIDSRETKKEWKKICSRQDKIVNRGGGKNDGGIGIQKVGAGPRSGFRTQKRGLSTVKI